MTLIILLIQGLTFNNWQATSASFRAISYFLYFKTPTAVMHVYMMMLAVLFSPAKLFRKFLNPRIPLCEY